MLGNTKIGYGRELGLKRQSKKLYEGWFENGVRHGNGVEYYPFTEIVLYNGNFIEGVRDSLNTPAKLMNRDGTVNYIGHYKEDEKIGMGSEYDENGKNTYRGKFKRNVHDSEFCVEYHNNGQIEYIGAKKKGKRNGAGMFFLTKHGKSEFRWLGVWRNDS